MSTAGRETERMINQLKRENAVTTVIIDALSVPDTSAPIVVSIGSRDSRARGHTLVVVHVPPATRG